MYMSHNILVPQKTVPLGPSAVLRFRGQLFNAAKSAVRALDMLELLNTADRPLRAVQIARPLGLSPSSANQLLKTLVDAAYLIFDPESKQYHPSPRVGKLSASHAKNYRSFCAIDDLMESAHRVLGKCMVLSTSQGSCMQVLDVLQPSNHSSEKPLIPIETWVGMRIPLFGSCHGAAWLSTQSDQTICATAQRCRRELKANSLDQIFERIRRVQAQGYAFGGLTEFDRERMLAMALPQSRNGIVLVLGTYGPASEMENKREEIAHILREHIVRYGQSAPERDAPAV